VVSTFDAVIVPAILIGAFLAALLVLAIWLARRRIELWKAQQASEDAVASWHGDKQRLIAQQAAAIDSVIAEMTEHPSITLSADTRDALFAAATTTLMLPWRARVRAGAPVSPSRERPPARQARCTT